VLADDLRTQITSGQLRPGERLPTEPQLCARSGLSRSTVREALRLLASQHLIVTTRGVTGGSFVARPSTAELADSLTLGMDMLLFSGSVVTADVLEARELIEVPAAAMAAERRTDDHLDAMRAALLDAQTGDLDARLAAHVRFHTVLAAATGNPLLELIAAPLYGLAHERVAAEHAPPEAIDMIRREHLAILRAIQQRDAAAAVQACRTHLTSLRPMYISPPTAEETLPPEEALPAEQAPPAEALPVRALSS
jgi:DNA-binding FadR family transcriptional regulator